mgnify:CR=1 FL=1
MNYQLNQILKSFSIPADTCYLVVGVYPRYLTLKDLSTGDYIRPSINSVFLDYCTIIGTADSHPELLI